MVLSKISSLIGWALLFSNVLTSDAWYIENNNHIIKLEEVVNEIFQKNVIECVDFNRDLITLLISDKIASEINYKEHFIIMSIDELFDWYVLDVNNKIDDLIPNIKNACYKKVLDDIKNNYKILVKDIN